MSLGNWLWPSSLRQLFCAASTSLNTMASDVLFERQPFERIVRCRTVAKVLPIGFEVGRGPATKSAAFAATPDANINFSPKSPTPSRARGGRVTRVTGGRRSAEYLQGLS